MNPRTIFLYLSLRCGCPVDTSVKQKHRPSRQTRCVNGCGNPPFHLSSLRAPQGARQSVFPLRVLRILSLFALRMTSRLLIFGFIFVTFVTVRAYFAFMRMVYCIAANAACVFKVRAIPVYMVNGTLFGKIANGAFAQRNSLVFLCFKFIYDRFCTEQP